MATGPGGTIVVATIKQTGPHVETRPINASDVVRANAHNYGAHHIDFGFGSPLGTTRARQSRKFECLMGSTWIYHWLSPSVPGRGDDHAN